MKKHIVGYAATAILAAVAGAALIASAGGDDLYKAALEQEVAGTLNMHLEVLALARQGHTDRALRLIESLVNNAVQSTVASASGEWTSLAPQTREALKIAKAFHQKFPTDAKVDEAAYQAIPDEPIQPRYCTNSVRTLLGLKPASGASQ